ncbi:MAG: ATP-binding protein [Pseudomonadota bacterium]
MFTIQVEDSGISYQLCSRKSLVEPIINDACHFLAELGCTCISGFKIVARELLFNAIEHGSLDSAKSKINFTIKPVDEINLFEITIQDQGNGFEFQRLNLSQEPLDPRHIENRGYFLINEIAEEIQFKEGGRHVSVFLRINRVIGFN